METLNLPPDARLLFQNDACIVLNKIPGESSETVAINGELLLPVHRLDTPVSGCLLLAKNKEAAAFLGSAFAGMGKVKVEKRYWVIVEKPDQKRTLPPDGELVHLLGVNTKINKSFAQPWENFPPKEAPRERSSQPHRQKLKKAVLRYHIAGVGDNYLFMEIDLVTGRHHQIRAQLAAIGLHVKGDLKYGARRSEKSGGIRLHAYSLAFPNPLKQSEKIVVKATPPFADPLWLAFMACVGIDSAPN